MWFLAESDAAEIKLSFNFKSNALSLNAMKCVGHQTLK